MVDSLMATDHQLIYFKVKNMLLLFGIASVVSALAGFYAGYKVGRFTRKKQMDWEKKYKDKCQSEWDYSIGQYRIMLRTNESFISMSVAECSDEGMACVLAECLFKYYLDHQATQAEEICVTRGIGNDRKVFFQKTFPWYVPSNEY